ncbi:MAG TPA: DNA repair protein RecO [Saprospiraceae bacterium]|nr:DNA repair protein RecO [Saprospiraceae bacterium]HPK08958.1 DNA repair protein RecO [Saprospiraceae bacterium]HPQ20530.1 DNA repair protein RecO [Saprospiraceae bacterium]HRX28588.1 DNA repair protein RecO [Saprospiraceae bacterium]
MEIVSNEGIVLRVLKYQESSVICDMYTREKGLRSYIVSGVRSTRSKSKTSVYQLMNILTFSAYDGNSEKLNRIKEANFAYLYHKLNFDVIRSSIGVFCLELTRNSIKEQESNPELYDFLINWFKYVDSGEKLNFSLLPLKFAIDLTGYLGFFPLNNSDQVNFYFDLLDGEFYNSTNSKYCTDEESGELISKLIKCQSSELSDIHAPAALRKKTLKYILDYYSLHIPNFRELKSIEVLATVLH